MGAHFTSLLRRNAGLFQQVVAYVQSFRAVRFVQHAAAVINATIPWPPDVATVIKAAPYVLFLALVPKAIVDLRTLLKKVPENVLDEEERDKKLTTALVTARRVLRSFVDACDEERLVFPDGSLHKQFCDQLCATTKEYLASSAAVSYTHLTLPTKRIV